MKVSAKRDLCNGPILSGMFLYALPLIATGILQTLYNAADTMVIGKFAGEESLSAVSSTAAFINLLVNLFMGLSAGVLTVVARHIGAKNEDLVRRSVHTAIPLALVCGAFLLVAGLLTSEPLLRLMGTGDGNEAVLQKATLYTRIYFLGMPGFLLYNFGGSILRAAGDTKRPLIYLTISGILNVLLNLLFVIVFHMDVAGVAVATIASQYLSAVLVLVCLIREKSEIHFSFSGMCFDRRQFMEILRIGLPSGIQSSMFSISNVIVQSTANTFQYLHVAGAGAAGQLENLLYTVITGYYTTTLAFTSQNFGAHKKKRIRSTLRYGHLLSLVTCIGLAAVLLVFNEPLLRIFTSEPVALEAGRVHLFIIAGTVFIDGAMQIQVGHLRGMGFSIVPMITSLVGTCGLRVGWIYTIFPLLGGTWGALYAAYPVTWLFTLCGHLLYTLYADRVLKQISEGSEEKSQKAAVTKP